MQYIRECILELKKSVFPNKTEMRKYFIVTVSVLIISSLFLYFVGAAVLEIFSKIYN